MLHGCNWFSSRQHSASRNFFPSSQSHNYLRPFTALIDLCEGYSHHPDNFFGTTNYMEREWWAQCLSSGQNLKVDPSYFQELLNPLSLTSMKSEDLALLQGPNSWISGRNLMWGSGIWPEWVTNPRVLAFRETMPLLWRNFNTVDSEPEGGWRWEMDVLLLILSPFLDISWAPNTVLGRTWGTWG
jgi:hypothetical protein